MSVSLPLPWLRALSDAFMPDTATISRYTQTNTADGVVETWADVGSVPCRVAPSGRGASERPGAEQVVERGVSEWWVHVPAGTDVTRFDRLVITSAEHPDGRTFEVTRVDARTYETVRDCLCTLVD